MSSSDASAGSSLRCIVGPTAAGKSALALAIADAAHGEIISADSRQIYRGFDIGTAKPTRAERARVPHRGIDVAEPTERWSAARFARDAAQWIAEATARKRPPLVVGGTGLWIAALVRPFAPIPALDPTRREALSEVFEGLSRDELRAWCAALDPDIARHGPAQWRRAIEVALLTGTRLSEWQRATPAPQWNAHYLLVDAGEALDDRIAARTDAMFAAGWMDEVRALSEHVPASAPAWKACGYERVRAAQTGGTPLDALRRAVIQETRQYARRQRTWFRRQLKHGVVTRVDATARDAVDQALSWWRETGRQG